MGRRFAPQAPDLEVHVRGIHVPVEFRSCFGGDVARRDGDSADPEFVTGLRDVDRILGENDRTIVGECVSEIHAFLGFAEGLERSAQPFAGPDSDRSRIARRMG